jgi:hypothetical protein
LRPVRVVKVRVPGGSSGSVLGVIVRRPAVFNRCCDAMSHEVSELVEEVRRMSKT